MATDGEFEGDFLVTVENRGDAVKKTISEMLETMVNVAGKGTTVGQLSKTRRINFTKR